MRDVIDTDDAPDAVGAYSQAIATDDLVFTAGQIPLTPEGELRAEASIEDQTRLALENLRQVLSAADSDLESVLKVTIFLDDIEDFSAMNSVYSTFFANDPPARSAVEAGALPKGVGIEIEAIALRR